jgi:hypothetical protein
MHSGYLLSQSQDTADCRCSAARPCNSSPQRVSCPRLSLQGDRTNWAVSLCRCEGHGLSPAFPSYLPEAFTPGPPDAPTLSQPVPSVQPQRQSREAMHHLAAGCSSQAAEVLGGRGSGRSSDAPCRFSAAPPGAAQRTTYRYPLARRIDTMATGTQFPPPPGARWVAPGLHSRPHCGIIACEFYVTYSEEEHRCER